MSKSEGGCTPFYSWSGLNYAARTDGASFCAYRVAGEWQPAVLHPSPVTRYAQMVLHTCAVRETYIFGFLSSKHVEFIYYGLRNSFSKSRYDQNKFSGFPRVFSHFPLRYSSDLTSVFAHIHHFQSSITSSDLIYILGLFIIELFTSNNRS